MNVRELKKALENVPDDYLVTVRVNDEYFYPIEEDVNDPNDTVVSRMGGGWEELFKGTFDLYITEKQSNQLVFNEPNQ
jgi:hypothetical protein